MPANYLMFDMELPKAVYIIGAVSGIDYYACFYKFEQREKELLAMGYRVVNPIRIVPRNSDWVTAMKICIPAMIECNAVSPLPCTWSSRGAMIEFNLAGELEMPIIMP